MHGGGILEGYGFAFTDFAHILDEVILKDVSALSNANWEMVSYSEFANFCIINTDNFLFLGDAKAETRNMVHDEEDGRCHGK